MEVLLLLIFVTIALYVCHIENKKGGKLKWVQMQ